MPSASQRFIDFTNAFAAGPIRGLGDVRLWGYAYLMAAVREAAKEALEGPEKKAAVLAGLDLVIDRLLAAIPYPFWLAWLRLIVAGLLKTELHRMAEQAIEAILHFQRGVV
jgi:hypothetical protein